MMRLVLLSALFLLTWSYAVPPTPSYDGAWWRSASKDERTGFIAGYLDCAVYDTGQKHLAAVAWNVLEPKVTKYYDAHTSELRTPVASVVSKLGSQEKPQKASSGEAYPEKHGIFDGEYWRQSLPAHRLGFVEGYLACQQSESKPAAAFTRAADWYVAQVSQWYGVKADDPSEINDKRSGKKIANVLLLFKDKAAGGTSVKKQ